VLANALPNWALLSGRRFLLTNADGMLIAATPGGRRPRRRRASRR